jgi:hypothetical protein
MNDCGNPDCKNPDCDGLSTGPCPDTVTITGTSDQRVILPSPELTTVGTTIAVHTFPPVGDDPSGYIQRFQVVIKRGEDGEPYRSWEDVT